MFRPSSLPRGRIHRPWPGVLLALAVVSMEVGAAGGVAAAAEVQTVRPALQRTRPTRSSDGRPKAPKSLSYIYGDGSKSGTESGGDPGTDPGGDGTGDAQAKVAAGADPGGVTGVDLSQQPVEVHESTTNTANLDDGSGGAYKDAVGVNDLGVCFCVDTPRPGWATLPGYGNHWDQRYEWSRAVSNPSLPTTVRLRFPFNFDTEFGRDFFRVEVDRGGFFEELARFSGTNKTGQGIFDQPAIFDQTFVVSPADYVGPNADRVHLRLRVTTDGAGSDEDGLYPSLGAAQVDELKVWFDGVQVGFAPFDIAPFADGWQASVPPFAGDFTKLLRLTSDPDPCRENVTFQFSFIDDGSPPRNDPSSSTGGSVSQRWTYGPGGHVVNYTDGISGGEVSLHNEWVTPAFAFDPPGPDDDGKYGALLGFGIWKHLPLENGIFYTWRVRSSGASNGQWGPWRDRGMSYYEPSAPHYERVEIDVSDLLESAPESVQVALGVIDLARALGLPGEDATPAPIFDNIWFAKYPRVGPAIAVQAADLFQDAFPQSGASDYNGPAVDLGVRLDVARDTNPLGGAILPGDSLVARVKSIVPGLGLGGPPVLKWVLRDNSAFANDRFHPPTATYPTALAGKCESPGTRGVVFGTVVGQAVLTATGASVADRYFFDLPDGKALPGAAYQNDEPALFFPGDEVHYFLEATDLQGVASTLPADTTGFFDFRDCSPYDRDFRVRALPALRVPVGGGLLVPPEILVIDDSGDRSRQETLSHTLLEAGFSEGADYDLYAVRAPASGESNGIGSAKAHGATVAQLSAYRILLYDAGDQGEFLLSDGSGAPLNDKGDDLGLLTTWRTLSGDRSMAHFGDNFVSGLGGGSSAGATYVQTLLATQLVDADLRDDISGQLTPVVVPVTGAAPTFSTSFVIGGCLASDQFDAILPRAVSGAHRTHEFLDLSGQAGSYSLAAGVWYERGGVNGLLRDATFPFSLSGILDSRTKNAGAPSSRAQFLRELVLNLGAVPGAPTGGTPLGSRPELLANVPNPFNPRTRIPFSLPASAAVRIDIYDLGGHRVRALVDERRPAGAQSVVWAGLDDRGRQVSSGVYVVQLRSGSSRLQRKIVLVR